MAHPVVAAARLYFLQTKTPLKSWQLVIGSEKIYSAEACLLTIDMQYHFQLCFEKK